jgi:hypothetical protein
VVAFVVLIKHVDRIGNRVSKLTPELHRNALTPDPYRNAARLSLMRWACKRACTLDPPPAAPGGWPRVPEPCSPGTRAVPDPRKNSVKRRKSSHVRVVRGTTLTNWCPNLHESDANSPSYSTPPKKFLLVMVAVLDIRPIRQAPAPLYRAPAPSRPRPAPRRRAGGKCWSVREKSVQRRPLRVGQLNTHYILHRQTATDLW